MQPLLLRPFALERQITLGGCALDKVSRTTDVPRATPSHNFRPLLETVLRAILDTLHGMQGMHDDMQVTLPLGPCNVVEDIVFNRVSVRECSLLELLDYVGREIRADARERFNPPHPARTKTVFPGEIADFENKKIADGADELAKEVLTELEKKTFSQRPVALSL